MTCSTSLITSYPTHFLRTVSTILTTFFTTIFAILTTIISEFFNTIVPFTTATIIILALLVGFASLCFVVAEMLGFEPSGELTKRGRGVVKPERQIQDTSAVGILKKVDERTRVRFEVQIFKGLVREQCERLEDLGVGVGAG